MQVTVTVTGLDNAEARLTALGDSLHDFTDALEGLGKSLILFYGDTVMNNDGTPLGETWAPLSEPYATWKKAHYPGRGTLDRTGVMKRSFTSEVTPDSLFIGNSAPYFPFNQQGTSRNLPARPMVGVNATVEDMIQVAIENDVRAKTEGTSI